MDFDDAVRSAVALGLGFVVALVGIGVAPTHTAVPISAGVGAGVLATIASRSLMGTTNYATLSGSLLFGAVGLALLRHGGEALIDTGETRVLLWVAIGGLVINELLVQTGQLIAAGGIERSNRHRMWAVPAAIIGLGIIAARRFDVDGAGPVLAWTLAGSGVGLHAVVVSQGWPGGTVVYGGTACALLLLFPASSPQHLTGATGEGSVSVLVARAGDSVTSRVSIAIARLQSIGFALAARLQTVMSGFPIPDTPASSTSPHGGGNAVTSNFDSTPTTPAERSSPHNHTDTGGGEVETAAIKAKTRTSAGSVPTAPNNVEPRRVASCQNCGQRRKTVRQRPIIDNHNGTAGTIELCAPCNASRRSTTTEQRCSDTVALPREAVLGTTGGDCRVCGMNHESVLELHPVVPLSARGYQHEQNVIPLCPTCHAEVHEG